ncbi:hypothetical protein TNIN_164411 [Trichonephila inaurata madagascariensis]|uniref:Uncharacterized protein n=1 Tax=Trichonephila inaurata madagascariensis TaxID=2747483 RepID=A0A8X6YJL6_9ARAC|nr:hypothetical protein TNIN_164411 [Trichonephila inaurata madagascariensis]
MIRSLVSRFEKLDSMTDRPGRGIHPNIRKEHSVEMGDRVLQMIHLSKLEVVLANWFISRTTLEALSLELCPPNQLARLSQFRDKGSALCDVDFPLALEEGILM